MLPALIEAPIAGDLEGVLGHEGKKISGKGLTSPVAF